MHSDDHSESHLPRNRLYNIHTGSKSHEKLLGIRRGSNPPYSKSTSIDPGSLKIGFLVLIQNAGFVRDNGTNQTKEGHRGRKPVSKKLLKRIGFAWFSKSVTIETNWSRDGPRLKSDTLRRGCRLQDRGTDQGRSESRLHVVTHGYDGREVRLLSTATFGGYFLMLLSTARDTYARNGAGHHVQIEVWDSVTRHCVRGSQRGIPRASHSGTLGKENPFWRFTTLHKFSLCFPCCRLSFHTSEMLTSRWPVQPQCLNITSLHIVRDVEYSKQYLWACILGVTSWTNLREI